MQFIRKVYAILTMQILLTTALSSISFFSDSYKTWIQSNQWMMWVSMFGAIGFMLLTYWKRKSYVRTQFRSYQTHQENTDSIHSP